MKIISFNINGIRAHFHQLTAIISQHQPNIIGLQETKVHDNMFPFEDIRKLGYQAYSYGQKSHYGVALISKETPIAVHYGFPINEPDAQRRIIMADFATLAGTMSVINGYFPQGERRDHPVKFPAKIYFYANLQSYLIQHHTPEQLLIVMGDINISPTDLDIGIGEENRKRWLRMGKCSFLPEERECVACLLDWGLVDTFRALAPESTNRYSWFDYRSAGFDNNRGLRIDVILASSALASYCTASDIDYDIRSIKRSSDHAPIWATFLGL
ncbi:MAG: exodeoxyribonuclease III [Candidatus Malihini olakiniferum]